MNLPKPPTPEQFRSAAKSELAENPSLESLSHTVEPKVLSTIVDFVTACKSPVFWTPQVEYPDFPHHSRLLSLFDTLLSNDGEKVIATQAVDRAISPLKRPLGNLMSQGWKVTLETLLDLEFAFRNRANPSRPRMLDFSQVD